MQQNFISSFSANRGGNSLKTHSHFTNSHTLPKIAISLALLLGGANITLAEESGGFVGIGIGGGDTELKTETITNGIKDNYKVNLGGINYGFVGGYKQFFTPYLGLRYYANLDLHHNLKKVKSNQIITAITYGANVDFLGNFVVTDIADFGGFIGLGIGGNTIKIKDFDTDFEFALNVGLRTNIATNHGVELVARVPLPIKLSSNSSSTGGTICFGSINSNPTICNEQTTNSSYKQTFKQIFSILARYTFSF